MRFEKALDPENTVRGLARAIELLRRVCPDMRLKGGVADRRAPLREIAPIRLPMSFVVRKLGKAIGQPEVTRILGALGFGVTELAAELIVTVPSWRATKDISLKDDLAEEVGRMTGYDSIAPTPPRIESVVPPANPLRPYLRRVRAQLTAQGFSEVYNYSFTNETDARRFGFDLGEHLAVRNPVASELTHLRRSLVPGLFQNILTNVRYFPEFRLFEIGNEIHPSGERALPEEMTHLAGALYSAHGNEQDFFEMKRVVECLFPEARLAASEARSYEHPARTANISWRSTIIGRLFELHPSILRAEGVEGRAIVLDVDLIAAERLAAAVTVKYTPLRKFPTSGFDLSLVCDLRKPVDAIGDELQKLAGADLAAIEFVRQYTGPPLPAGQKSVSYHLEAGALDHTLTTDEVTGIRNRVIDGMRALGFELRM
jgi:phenylalanyl-tRNA synthetase beta chain